MRIMAYVCLIVITSSALYALPPDHYASSSRLASGKWVKIEVKETGIQLISNTILRNLGFPDPDKVNVFGYGGRMISERLDENQIDDLPIVPSIKTDQGIVFFGHSNVKWTPTDNNATQFTHEINPYSDNSYYFISDCEESAIHPPLRDEVFPGSDETITSFTERILHERDVLAPSNTGRLMLGEDFRTQSTRSFQFDLPGIISDANMTVRFGAKVTNGMSTLLFTANGTRLPATEDDKISGVSSNDTFIATTTTSKVISGSDDKLDLSIQYSHSGALFTAALDYIQINYERELRLHDNELYFYVSSEQPASVKISGCDINTIILDVTDPLNPKQLVYSLSGSDAIFNKASGYSEFVAFNPAKVSRAVTPSGRINNQNLHSAEAPGLLIITPNEYRSAAEKIAGIHEKSDGLSSLIVSPEMVYNEFSSGTPDVSAFRKLLKMWFDKSAYSGSDYTRYCLIISRPTYDNKMVTSSVKNAGYPRIPIWQSPTGFSEATSYSCDDYIGMLEDYYPGWDIGNAKINVAVGRMPVTSATEAISAANKLEKYVLNPEYGPWRNNVMVIADDQDNGTHLSQAESVCAALHDNGNGSAFTYEKLYLDSYVLDYSATGPVYPEAKQRMFDKLTEGVLFWNYIGHASPKSWGHENLLSWEDISSMNNKRLPFLYAATCEFMRWDSDDISGAEKMWLNPDAGVIGMICPSRTVYISLNGPLNVNTSEFVFRRDHNGKSMRIGDIMVEGKNAQGKDDNKLRYGLMGDPAMRLPSPDYVVNIDNIDSNDLSDPNNLPVLNARSTVKISGSIKDMNGNVADDYNGSVSLRLYDAEKVVTTNGNGDNGREMSYNDRKSRLYSGKAIAHNGRWETTIMLPSEIENNYSPALLSAYAHDSLGREANGYTDKFYIYGYDPESSEDLEGPVISSIYLDSPSFSNGDTVGPYPVLKARFSDESGINSSETGIGHSMKIELDNEIYFNDVAIYFSPDESDPTAGEISYQFNNLNPGEHTLTFTVWDNANNSSSASLSFKIKAGWLPGISDLRTDVNPASSNVNFLISSDSSAGINNCEIEVFDLSGRKIWGGETGSAVSSSNISIGWNLEDYNGARVARGIYPYRAILHTSSGAKVTKSGKLAVTAK